MIMNILVKISYSYLITKNKIFDINLKFLIQFFKKKQYYYLKPLDVQNKRIGLLYQTVIILKSPLFPISFIMSQLQFQNKLNKNKIVLFGTLQVLGVIKTVDELFKFLSFSAAISYRYFKHVIIVLSTSNFSW